MNAKERKYHQEIEKAKMHGLKQLPHRDKGDPKIS